MVINLLAWIECRKGATAIEYVLIAGGIGIGIFAAIIATGGNLENFFSSFSDTWLAQQSE